MQYFEKFGRVANTPNAPALIALLVRKHLFYNNSNHIFYEPNKHNPFSVHRAYSCRFDVVTFQAIQNIVL